MDELIYKTVTELSDTFNQLEEWAASMLQTNLSSFIDRGMAMASIDNVLGGDNHIVGFTASHVVLKTKLESIFHLKAWSRNHKPRNLFFDLSTSPNQTGPRYAKAGRIVNQELNQKQGSIFQTR